MAIIISNVLPFTSFFSLYTAIQNRNPVWYQALTHGLNEEQRKQLQDIATLADQRRAAHGMLVNLTSSDAINDFKQLLYIHVKGFNIV